MFLVACSTTRVTYEVSDAEPKVQTSSSLEEIPTPFVEGEIPTREPDIQSVPATVTFDYPERVNPALYEVTQEVNVRDFPSTEGNIIGTLKVGDKVVGNEIEGTWIRIYENSYTSLRFLKTVY
jgi:hypothetical protein